MRPQGPAGAGFCGYNNYMIKKQKPVAKCTKCGHYTDISSLINQACPRNFVKKGKCKGVYRSMLSVNDWRECTDCSATGIISDKDCGACQGYGWICIRKNY